LSEYVTNHHRYVQQRHPFTSNLHYAAYDAAIRRSGWRAAELILRRIVDVPDVVDPDSNHAVPIPRQQNESAVSTPR
jgi:hypothetical protein